MMKESKSFSTLTPQLNIWSQKPTITAYKKTKLDLKCQSSVHFLDHSDQIMHICPSQSNKIKLHYVFIAQNSEMIDFEK